MLPYLIRYYNINNNNDYNININIIYNIFYNIYNTYNINFKEV